MTLADAREQAKRRSKFEKGPIAVIKNGLRFATESYSTLIPKEEIVEVVWV